MNLCLLVLTLAAVLSCSASEWVVETIVGTGKPGRNGDGGPATQAQINNPYGVVMGPDGTLYICDMDNHLIRTVNRQGVISTIAGTGRRGFSGNGGPALQADLNEPYEVRIAPDGHLFVVEMRNHLVRRVDRTGTIHAVAGTGQPGFSGDDGPATAAQLNQPHSIQLKGAEQLFICDIGNHRVRHVNLQTGRISTFAGTGGRQATPDGAPIANTPLNGPRALDFDPDGNIWLALREGNAIYKLDLASGTLHHAAGTGAKGFAGNGGPAREAFLSGPKGISVGPDGHVYFADTESHTIRRLNTHKGTIELVAGTGERGDGPDGRALACKMARPHGIYVHSDGRIYVGDSENHKVRLIRKL